MSSYTTRPGLGFHRELLSKTAFFTVKKLPCCISIPSTLFCAHLHFAAPPTLLGLLSCAKTASVCCCISTFYYDTWFFYYNSWMVSRIHLHLINIPHSTNPNIKDVSVKCAMPLQLIYILKSPQILHNSLKFTTANLVPEKTSNEIRWLCSVTLHLCAMKYLIVFIWHQQKVLVVWLLIKQYCWRILGSDYSVGGQMRPWKKPHKKYKH